jgi:hypothetical protein
VVLGDGADWIWNWAYDYFPPVLRLLNFYHVAEHMYAAAEALWPTDTAKSWCEERMLQLKKGQEDHFFASLQWLAVRHAKVEREKASKNSCITFSKIVIAWTTLGSCIAICPWDRGW